MPGHGPARHLRRGLLGVHVCVCRVSGRSIHPSIEGRLAPCLRVHIPPALEVVGWGGVVITHTPQAAKKAHLHGAAAGHHRRGPERARGARQKLAGSEHLPVFGVSWVWRGVGFG